jgi:hypothetical protein
MKKSGEEVASHSIEKAAEMSAKKTAKERVREAARDAARFFDGHTSGIAHIAQAATTVATASATAAGGFYAMQTADAGFELASVDVQRARIEKMQAQLDKLFEQCSEDLKLISKELQRDNALLADMLWGNIKNREKNTAALFRGARLAA